MTRVPLTLATLGFAVVLSCTVAACSSTTDGTGAAAKTTSTRSSASPSPSTTAASSANASTVSRPPTTASIVPSTATTSASSATTTAVAGPAQVLNVSYQVTCASNADPAGTVKLSWTTKGANQVYVLPGQVASVLVGADAKIGGGKGPFAANGSATLAFTCSEQYGYYLVQAYNTSDSSKNGVVQQVPR